MGPYDYEWDDDTADAAEYAAQEGYDQAKEDRSNMMVVLTDDDAALHDGMYSVAGFAAADLMRSATAAYWAERPQDLPFHANKVTEALRRAADALGYVVMTQAEHDDLMGFVENVRDDTPNIVNHRHSGWSRNPEDEVPDLMEADAFRWHQDEAAKLAPKPPKAAKAVL